MAILSELPDSVVSKILTRLPVKSLTQCRCVGKSWYNLISDPYFIWSHLSQRSAEEKGYLVTGHISKLCMEEHYSFRCDETFLEKLKIERTISESTGGFILVGCAKGLLLMLSLKTSDSDSDLHLWNPGLQKIKPLPSTHATHKYKFHLEAFGFAFLPEICDYKVVRILDFFFDVSRVVEIYSLKTDSWRRIETPVMRLVPLHKGLILASFVNPYFYWVATTFQDNQCTDCIVSFNIKCETFKLTGLPVDCLQDGHLEGTLAVFQESLYLFAYQIREGWSLWMMKENCSSEMYWSKLCIFEYEDRWPIGFMKNGDVIMKNVYHKASLHDPGNVSNPWKYEREMKGGKRCSEVYNYSPSLALLNQRNGGDQSNYAGMST